MNSYTEAETEMSLKSRSLLHRVIDRVRKMLDQSSKDTTKDSDKHSLIWRMFKSSTLQASVFMVKEYSENLRSIKNTGNNLTMKQMLDISGAGPQGSWDRITLPRDESFTETKGWIRGNTMIGPVLEVTTCCLQGKYGVEIRIKSMKKDHSHSCVRISHGLNKLVTNLNNKENDDNEQETSEMQFEDYALKSNARASASRSKAKARPQRRISVSSSTKTFFVGERTWTDIEPQDCSPTDCSVSKKLTNLLRHGHLPREDDGANEFWRKKDYLQNHVVHSRLWSDEKWKSTMEKGGGNKKIFNIVPIHQDKKLFISELLKVFQDAISLILHYRAMS